MKPMSAQDRKVVLKSISEFVEILKNPEIEVARLNELPKFFVDSKDATVESVERDAIKQIRLALEVLESGMIAD